MSNYASISCCAISNYDYIRPIASLFMQGGSSNSSTSIFNEGKGLKKSPLKGNKIKKEESLNKDKSEPIKREYQRSILKNPWAELILNPRQFGAALFGLGILVSCMGFVLMLERSLLRVGNLLSVAGAILLIGFDMLYPFFMDRSRWLLSVSFLIGFGLVIYGKSRLGVFMQIITILIMAVTMIPKLIEKIKNMPFIGDMISSAIGGNSNGSAGMDLFSSMLRGGEIDTNSLINNSF